MREYSCLICGYTTQTPNLSELGKVQGNTENYINSSFYLWKCPNCQTIYSLDPVDFKEIYSNYPLNNRRMDSYAKATLGNLLKRLKQQGLKKEDKIVDYGCGNGLLVDFLKQKGYKDTIGFDPYVEAFNKIPEPTEQFNWIIANDVIEHTENPKELIRACLALLKPEGFLYIGMPDPEGVLDMGNLQKHVMRLHQPYHRIIISLTSLLKLSQDFNLKLIKSYRRSYMDTLIPFANYRFLDELSAALNHNMDQMLSPPAAAKAFLSHPMLLFYGLMGYFFPSAYEPAVIWQKSSS